MGMKEFVPKKRLKIGFGRHRMNLMNVLVFNSGPPYIAGDNNTQLSTN